MSERERSKDRSPAKHTPHSSSGGYFMGLFGGGSRRAAPPSTTRTHATQDGKLKPLDDIISPRSGTVGLPPPVTQPIRQPSPAPFDLSAAILVMQDEELSPNSYEVVNMAAAHLANNLASDDIFSAPSAGEAKASTTSMDDIKSLYTCATSFASGKNETNLRIASVRLLAALIATHPPKTPMESSSLPDFINVRAIYKLIIAPVFQTSMATHVDAVFVNVGALKALTKNGQMVEGLDGLIGWLVKNITALTEPFAEWCSRKEELGDWARDDVRNLGAIKPATPCETIIAIIDLLTCVLAAHISLFSTPDLDKIVQPIISLLSAGIASSNATSDDQTASTTTGASRRSSPMASALNSPLMSATGGALGFEPSLRHSIVSQRSKKDSHLPSQQNTPVTKSMARAIVATTTAVSSPQIAGSPYQSAAVAHFGQPEARWTQPIPAFCALLELLANEAAVSDGLLRDTLLFLCLCFGQDETEHVPESSWTALYDVLHIALGSKGGKRGEQILHMILEGTLQPVARSDKYKVLDADRKVARGAVISTRSLFHHLSSSSGDVPSTSPISSIVPALRAAQSTSRFVGAKQVSERARWQPVDYEILALLQDHIYHLEMEGAAGGHIDDAWTEGNAACDLLHGIVPVVMGSSPHLARRGSEATLDPNPLRSIFDQIIHQLPGAIQRLYSSTSMAGLFFHPRYIDLLLDIAPHLDEEDAGIVIDYYQRECLCLPFTSGWIKNIWRLLEAFYIPFTATHSTRRKITSLLFRDVYKYAEDLPEHRIELVQKAIVPFLESVLVEDDDDDFVREALDVLVNAAVAETMERDDDRRKARASKKSEENDEEDASALPSEEVNDAASGGSFDAVRMLIIRLATQTLCKEGHDGTPVAHPRAPGASLAMSASTSGASLDGSSVERRASVRSKENAPSALRGIMEALSPPQKTRDLPSVSAVTSPTNDHDAPSLHSLVTAPTPADSPPEIASPHADCRSLYSVTSLISIFVRLAFAAPHSLTTIAKAARTPASSRSITIYRDLLGLLYPMTDDQATTKETAAKQVKIPARCPKARITILRFLVRLRADIKHRIFFRADIDRFITAYATILKRTKDTEPEKRTEPEDKRARPAGRPDEERGRGMRMQDTNTRSRSRSKQPATVLRGNADASYNPLWRIPDELSFEQPEESLPSEGMTTYDPNHPSLKDPNAPPVEGIWLPVSEYVRVLNGILRGHDWELVAYVLTFLPLQLSNKLFFHGGRAIKEVRALLDVLCSGVLGQGSWDRRFNTPLFIKRADVNAAAYHTLSILISYHGVFTRAESDRLVQAFIAGLQGKGELAKPCLQALTLAVYELEQSVSRNLLEIVRAMTSILTTTGLAVHILEFMIALGQNNNLYRNFTEEQYRLVFRVAIGYITEHNARSDQTLDLKDVSTREAYILSQHVIGLAYYAIYVWFMALRVPQRPDRVSEITREILKGKSQRVNIDEMVEVCFDWLARYTYGNADPKPATSFLQEMVMAGSKDAGETKTQSWLLGGAIITVTSHVRTGWATITTTRPTGTTAVVCKVENVPLVDLGEAQADLVSLPAVLMANRDPQAVATMKAAAVKSVEQVAETEGGQEAEQELPEPKAVVQAHPSANPQDANNTQLGLIWSGAAPSQRRKDVTIDPSYLALQLLSSYPNTSLETPRGRLIPNEDKFLRALRGIQNTPVIDTMKIAVLYVGPGQTTETEILGNIDGTPLYLDFLSGLGRLIRLKGQVDVFVGGLNRDNDSDGEYAYAWWDDLCQLIFHTPTMMPNLAAYPNFENKKRLVGNDYVKIIYNDSGKEFAFDTIKTAWNFINVIVSPYNTGAGEDELPKGMLGTSLEQQAMHYPGGGAKNDEGWADWDREDWFKVTLQRVPGIPDFSPIGTHKLVSRKALPVFVRHIAHLANDLAARFNHIREAPDAASAEYITSWRARLRAMHRLKASLPPVEMPDKDDEHAREQLLRDFTRLFSYRPPAPKEQ